MKQYFPIENLVCQTRDTAGNWHVVPTGAVGDLMAPATWKKFWPLRVNIIGDHKHNKAGVAENIYQLKALLLEVGAGQSKTPYDVAKKTEAMLKTPMRGLRDTKNPFAWVTAR